MKKMKGYAIFNIRDGLVVVDEKLPIYWNESIAVKEVAKFKNAHVEKVIISTANVNDVQQIEVENMNKTSGASVEELRNRIHEILHDKVSSISNTQCEERIEALLAPISDSNQQALRLHSGQAELDAARKIAQAAQEAGLVPQELTSPDDWKKAVQKVEAEVIAKHQDVIVNAYQLIDGFSQYAKKDSDWSEWDEQTRVNLGKLLSPTGGDTEIPNEYMKQALKQSEEDVKAGRVTSLQDDYDFMLKKQAKERKREQMNQDLQNTPQDSSDLKPFKHGEEGTHYACREMVDKCAGDTTQLHCCGCNNHDCQPEEK